MRILVHQLSGEVDISFYGKCGYHIHTENFNGNISGDNGGYERSIPVEFESVKVHLSKAISIGAFVRYELQP